MMAGAFMPVRGPGEVVQRSAKVGEAVVRLGCYSHPHALTFISSMSKMTVLSVSPSPLARRVGLKMVVYRRWRFENTRGIGSEVLSW